MLKKAGAAADRIDWPTVDRILRERRGIPTRITRPLAPPMMAHAAKVADEDASFVLVKWLRRQLSSSH